ncbi:hypothetical protein JZ751_024902 [Albula glossodonta]|uniref:Leucine-rich repeat-containing protein 19-like n=1 Tax=Albula glossodonta TaxID=121402 RepID=A0A8T2PCA4_9TELE|nr:hypothetical protein JZ751_024902 [Albula glossodonta]
MGSVRLLGLVMCFWGTVTGNAPQPCVHGNREVLCSNMKLTGILGQVLHNTTELDLSENHLNLSHPKSLQQLTKFDRLVALNLSGNYLPLLEKRHLSSLSTLQILDLSRCQLAGIENGAFQRLSKLQTLLLGGNELRDPLPIALKDLRALASLDLRGCMKNLNVQRFRRKLLAEVDSTLSTPTVNGTDTSKEHPSHSWQYLVAVLVTAISISILIALGAKFKIFHRYLASYRHTRLTEGDTASHCDPMSLEVGFSGQGATDRGPDTAAPIEPDDDDGFIEDNYIQACERERAERAAEELEDDDDIQFTIG